MLKLSTAVIRMCLTLQSGLHLKIVPVLSHRHSLAVQANYCLFRGGIDSERSTLVQLCSGTMHVLPSEERKQRAHAVESWAGVSLRTVYLSSALLFSGTLSQICLCGSILGVGVFFPSEFGCKCNFCEISHGVSSYAK